MANCGIAFFIETLFDGNVFVFGCRFVVSLLMFIIFLVIAMFVRISRSYFKLMARNYDQ